MQAEPRKDKPIVKGTSAEVKAAAEAEAVDAWYSICPQPLWGAAAGVETVEGRRGRSTGGRQLRHVSLGRGKGQLPVRGGLRAQRESGLRGSLQGVNARAAAAAPGIVSQRTLYSLEKIVAPN